MFTRVLFATLLLASAGCGSKDVEEKPVTSQSQPPKPAAAKAPKPLKIGVITILTGQNADYGAYTRNGLQLAHKQVGDGAVELLYADSKADPKEAVRVYKELRAKGVVAVIGPFTSTEVRVVAPEAQRDKIPMITSSATADDLSKVGDHLFMMLPPNSKQGADQAVYASNSLKAKRSAILYRQNPYGQTLRAAFSKAFKAAGGEIVVDEGFPDGTEDFRDRLKVIAAAAPDVVFAPVHDADTGRILRQAHEVGMKSIKLLGADGSMTAKTIELAKEAAEGAVFSNVASVDPVFDAKYKEAYGKATNPYAASAYDTLNILLDVIKSGARTAPAIQKSLANLKPHKGASGVTQFKKMNNSYWATNKPYSQFIVKDGKYDLIRP